MVAATRTDGAVGLLRVEEAMGMPIIVDIRDAGVGDGPADAVFAWFRHVDEVFSTYKETSEITRLNRGLLTIHDAAPEVRAVLQRCEELRAETDGYFDVRLRDRASVDPSGLVKGWSVDRAAQLLDAAGVRNYAVNAGGDLVARGGALPATAWRIGIQHPSARGSVAKVVVGTRLAVATSGAYERGAHIVDPHTGDAPEGVLSVTVTGPELARADAYATAAYARGAAAAEWTRTLPRRGYEAMTILADGRVLTTPDFPASTPAG